MKLPTLEHFGTCPECHGGDGYLNLRRDHVFYCERHKTGWCVGSNLFSSWQYETEADWQANRERLEGFRVVEPSRWGWSDVSRGELLRWFREWLHYFAWRTYRPALGRLRNKYWPRKAVDSDLPF